MLKEIKNELYYQTKSYMIFVCMIAVIVCSVYVGYTQIKNVENSYNIVKTVKTQFENENEEFSKKSAENILNEQGKFDKSIFFFSYVIWYYNYNVYLYNVCTDYMILIIIL